MTNLSGSYHLDKANMVCPAQNLHLVIGTRRKPTPQKPPFYLLQRLSPQQHIYISSLFEWQEVASNEPTGAKNWYSFDWQGTNYVLCLDHASKEARISLLGTPSPFTQKPIKEGLLGNSR